MIRVLIVEDEASVRSDIAAAVDWESLDCTIIGEAEDGEEGLRAALLYAPDLILTDVNMPKKDGLSMLRDLKDAGGKSAVIIISAHREFSYAQQALRLGAADYLVKPLRDGELQRAVERVLGRGASESADVTDRLPALAIGGMSKYVTETVAYIAEHYGNADLTVGMIAEHLHISEGHLSHVFRRDTGFTLVEYLAQYRIREAAKRLTDVRVKIYEVAQAVGYQDVAYFSGSFRKLIGCTPSEYQNAH